jgi:hypothetical protein
MGNRGNLTKFLAVLGTVLLVFTVLAPLVFAGIALFSSGRFFLDYFFPAEVFPFVLVGSGLLIAAAIRARAYRWLILWSVVIGLAALIGGQALAVATGLASGEIEPRGIWFNLALGSIIGFDLAVVTTMIGGLLLLRNLYRSSPPGDQQTGA